MQIIKSVDVNEIYTVGSRSLRPFENMIQNGNKTFNFEEKKNAAKTAFIWSKIQ